MRTKTKTLTAIAVAAARGGTALAGASYAGHRGGGMGFLDKGQLALATLGDDRIMFSVDYPMASATAGADWFRADDPLRAKKEKLAHGNAERLLGVGPF